MRITGIVRKVEKLRKLREDVEYEKIPFLFVAAIKDLPEEYLPDLEIEVVPAEKAQLVVSENRIVDIDFFIKQTKKLHLHGSTYTMGRKQFQKELKNGVTSILYYHCDNCEKTITLSSHPKEAKINCDFVWGSTAISIGKGKAEELFSVIDMSTPSSRFYRKLENDVGRVWEMQLQSEIKKGTDEERKLAIEAGDIKEGIPFITVIVDGGWAKHSYGHGNTDAPTHVCLKNYTGSSFSMEQDTQ
ncbi:hypothetical protein ILUMI_18160 [Ignelater luminosus]|uniref:Mutator-like transposase domain-containing protein n=1 Tax=Ignelater luminosus TaxID=2038154 RepID=A0A8K0G764_IGNLU|nr:hypothetical protein ILUMI_18160 [Ignelater luminosus]